MPQKPGVGRIVHYIPFDGPNKGTHCAAIVTCVWSDCCVNLRVFAPHTADEGVYLKTSVLIDETPTPSFGTWHWPERE